MCEMRQMDKETACLQQFCTFLAQRSASAAKEQAASCCRLKPEPCIFLKETFCEPLGYACWFFCC